MCDRRPAGADVATTCSYQASFAGFERAGLGRVEAEELLRRSVRLADRARERFWGEHSEALAAAGDAHETRDQAFVLGSASTPHGHSRTDGALASAPADAHANGVASSARPECNGGSHRDGDALVGGAGGEGQGLGWGLAGWQWARGRPLVAFSLGSYGAALADGSEYTGAYGARMTEEQLLVFHRQRMQVGAHVFWYLQLGFVARMQPS